MAASVFQLKTPTTGQQPDTAEVVRAARLLFDPGLGVQIQRLKSGTAAVVKGDDYPAIEELVRDFNAGSTGIYFSLNPVDPGLLLEPGKGIKAGDVMHRRWFLVDLDTKRGEKDSNATEAEKEDARSIADRVIAWLTERGWPAPLIVDSGNGWHLLYRVDLPNNNHARVLLKGCLYELARQFDTDTVGIDKKTHNANRISKLPGTWARKAEHTRDRPQRLARIVFEPEALEAVPVDLLAELAGTTIKEPEHYAGPANGQPFKVYAGGEGDARKLAYARRALEGEVGRVSLAVAGPDEGRNNALNEAAFRLGTLVGGGCIGRDEVEWRLMEVALLRGLPESEAKKTIRSGLEAGIQQPRVPPEKNGQPVKPAADAVPAGETITFKASSVKPRKVEWLWPWRIPLGKLTTFAGQGGLGKTFVLCDITARVTRGLDWPDSSGLCCDPGYVLFVSGEDDVDDTLVPRLIECGADLEKVAFLKTEVQDCFTIGDLKTLDRALAEQAGKVRLVVIDPPAAFLGAVDDHKNAEVRSLLSPLKSWASRNGLSVVFNTHFTKSGGAKVEAIQRVMASVAWVNAVRAAHAFAKDPEDPERILFMPMKMNLGKRRNGLAYKIIETTDDMARVQWLGEVDLTADEAVNKESKRVRRDVVAAEWLIERFRGKREWYSDDLFRAAHQEGISRSAIFEARKKLDGIKVVKETSKNGDHAWLWTVPPDWPAFQPSQPPETVNQLNHLTQEEF